MYTVTSLANSVFGTLYEACFHPHVLLDLEDGRRVKMKNIRLGDVLKGGSKVMGTMWISNLDNNGEHVHNYYILPSEDGNDIFVTGKHLVEYNGLFINVERHPDAIAAGADYTTDKFCCLITDDHRIRIGEYIFWDWEDGN